MPPLKNNTARLVAIFSAVSLLLTLFALLNWLVRSIGIHSGLLFFLQIAPTTALSGLVLSFLILIRTLKNKCLSRVDILFLGFVMIYALSVIAAYFWDIVGHPETILSNRNMAYDGTLIGAMSPLTALAYLLLSTAYLIAFSAKGYFKNSTLYSTIYTSLAFLLALVIFYSFISGVHLVSVMNAVPMSMATSIALIFLALALFEQVDKGVLHIRRFVSGISGGEHRGQINNLNFTIFIALIIAVTISGVFYLRTENKSYRMQLREQLILELDNKVNTLTSWIALRYNMVKEVQSNRELPQGMEDVLIGRVESSSAVYALTWMHIVFLQNPGSRLALYDTENGTSRAAPAKPNISALELEEVRSWLQRNPGPYVQDKISYDVGEEGYHKLQYIRFWTSLYEGGKGPLLLLELIPGSNILDISQDTLSPSGKSYTLILSYDERGLHFISRLPQESDIAGRQRIRDIMSTNIYRLQHTGAKKTVVEGLDHRGYEAMSALAELEHLPWLIVHNIDMESRNSLLKGKVWLLFCLNMIMLFSAAMYMNYSSRKKKDLDNQMISSQWRSTFDAVPAVIWLLDEEHRILRTNYAVEDFFGINPREAMGKRSDEILPALADHLDYQWENEAQKITVELQDNELWFSVSIAPIMGDNKSNFGYVHIINNITEQKRGVDRLKVSEEQFRAIFDKAPIGIAIVGKNMQYLRSNESYRKMLGYSAEELSTMTVMDVTHPYFLDQDKEGITKLLSSETPVFECEKKFICKDGSEIWALVTVVKFWDEERGEEVMLAMAQNIQDRVLAMQELHWAKERAVLSERLKSSFMQNMSHEFRTPMNGIMGFSQLLMQGVQDQNDVKEFGQYINRSGKRMLQLIDNILDFAKIDSGQEAVQKEAFNVDHMLNKILDLYRSPAFSKGLELNYVIPDNLKNTMVHTDEQKLLQILAKLMDNAIDFTSKGKVEITADIKEGSLILNVKDTGCGISKANLSIIFDSFYQADMSYTRAHEGVGLGLPICRGLARLLDGDITVVSEPGIGSEFSIVVPVTLVEQD